jgi:hypothetical protein
LGRLKRRTVLQYLSFPRTIYWLLIERRARLALHSSKADVSDLGCSPLIVSNAQSIAFTSQRLVPGRDGGNFPDRTQFEKVLIEILQ